MSEGDLVRPDVEVAITWNPNDGGMKLTASSGNPMELMGVMFTALVMQWAKIMQPPQPPTIVMPRPGGIRGQ